MLRSVLTVALCWVIVVTGAAEERQTAAQYAVERCKPKIAKKASCQGAQSCSEKLGKSPQVFPPVISYEILESGEVTNAQVKRCCGFSAIDKFALNQIQAMKYNSRRDVGLLRGRSV
jgi:outer membrane biosynthesis protein TonB